jgi:hypothetical protein
MLSRDPHPDGTYQGALRIVGLAPLPAQPGRLPERPVDRTGQARRWRFLNRCLGRAPHSNKSPP